MGDLLLGTIQAAELLGVSRYYLLEHKAEFDHVVLPGKRPSYRWYKASLEAWLAYRTHRAKIPLGQDDPGRALPQPAGLFGQKGGGNRPGPVGGGISGQRTASQPQPDPFGLRAHYDRIRRAREEAGLAAQPRKRPAPEGH